MKKIMSWLENVMAKRKYNEIPNAFMDRMLKTAALSILCMALGTAVGMVDKSPSFVALSAAIALCGFFRVWRLCKIAVNGDFETVEGRVVQAQGRRVPGRRLYMVHLMLGDGSHTDLVMDKNNKVVVGKSYRFYFHKRKNVMVGTKRMSAYINVGSFLGYEELETVNF